ncbi:hypothetical protein L218DRAFT_943745 [Marasmius fiardii PR-910]|nr:hypothetical protein L218DRAFT_943745 [Marasmius fiardii PR-910]
MSSDHGGPSRGRGIGRSSSASAAAARSSGSTPPTSRIVFFPPEESQALSSSSSASVLGSDVCGRYRSTVPSQARSRSSSVIREESSSPSTARPISRSSSPASSAGSPSHGDQEMGDVLEMLAQPLVLNMLEAQGEDSTARLLQQQPASTSGTSTSASIASTGAQHATSGRDSMNVDPPGAPSGPTTSRGGRGAVLGRGPPLSVNRTTRPQRPATRVVPMYASAARKGAAVLEAVIAMTRAAPTLPADRIMEAARVISGQGKGKAKARSSPKFTSSGPSRKQVLVSFDKERGVPSMNLAMVAATVSAALRNGGKHLRVQSTSPAYNGWSLSTSAIATTAEIDIIRDRIREILPQDRRGNDSFWNS